MTRRRLYYKKENAEVAAELPFSPGALEFLITNDAKVALRVLVPLLL